ncbi:hypothetical protein GJ496_004471 [Pomphorhynchus laevis]|nr:hypothetical protein GJ496_004471 [Pomphorhynchus laevis]
MGFFAYYSKWIKNFPAKAAPLTGAYVEFPLNKLAQDAIDILKEELSNAVVYTISENEPFTIETDASEYSIAPCSKWYPLQQIGSEEGIDRLVFSNNNREIAKSDRKFRISITENGYRNENNTAGETTSENEQPIQSDLMSNILY